jgi:hypothetical protein
MDLRQLRLQMRAMPFDSEGDLLLPLRQVQHRLPKQQPPPLKGKIVPAEPIAAQAQAAKVALPL